MQLMVGHMTVQGLPCDLIVWEIRPCCHGYRRGGGGGLTNQRSQEDERRQDMHLFEVLFLVGTSNVARRIEIVFRNKIIAEWSRN